MGTGPPPLCHQVGRADPVPTGAPLPRRWSIPLRHPLRCESRIPLPGQYRSRGPLLHRPPGLPHLPRRPGAAERSRQRPRPAPRLRPHPAGEPLRKPCHLHRQRSRADAGDSPHRRADSRRIGLATGLRDRRPVPSLRQPALWHLLPGAAARPLRRSSRRGAVSLQRRPISRRALAGDHRRRP